MTRNIRRRLLPAALVAATALALAGCTFDAPGSEAGASDGAAAGLDGLVKPGVLSVGVTLPDAPYMIPDADNVPQSGITKDLLDAVAAELGLEIEFIPVAWEGGITGVAAGRYDIYGGSLYDTLERQQAGTFVDFMTEQATLITTAGNGGAYATRLDACGQTIATIRGTTDVSYAEALTAECEEAGKPGMQVTEYPTQQDAELALESGRTALGIQSEAGAAYAIEQGANREIVAEPFDGGFYVGSMMNTAKPELIDAVLAAMTTLYEDGTTEELFAKYGVKPVAPGINLQK